jgi:hypothetical protein
MLNAARLTKELREGVWAEAAKMATDLTNLAVTPNQPVAPLHRFYEITNPKLKVTKPFGEMAIVQNNQRRKIRSKLEDRGRPCMFLGRAPNHADDTYRFLNLATKHVIVSRDVLWLGKCYGDWKGLTMNTFTVVPADNDSDDDDDLAPAPGRAEGTEVADGGNGDIISLQDDNEGKDDEDYDLLNDEGKDLPSVNQPKLSREMKRLSGFFNPAASAYGKIDRRAPSTEVVPEQMDVVPTTEINDTAMVEIDYEKVDPTTYRDIFKLPKTFEEAWNHECPFQRKMWRDAITKEDTKMTENKVI